ncbi:MAG: ABC transporter substrate-binding protein [Zoogloeaceae bacterium]|nr:ABC transporter substrate-binding protein [Zoogloeaceae bacterium]
MTQKNGTRVGHVSPVDTGRRSLLRAAGSVALAGPLLAMGGNAWGAPAVATAKKTLTPLKFAWNQTAFCLTPIAVAKEAGIFAKNGLDVTLDNFGGSTDQLLEAIATGKADAAIGMIHRWLKPLESGFDVKIVGSAHGGCLSLVAYQPAKITRLSDLRGKTIGVADMGSPAKNFFSIYLRKHGIDPERDVTWRQYPRDLFGIAAEKGEIHAIADQDPQVFTIKKHSKGAFVDLATNISGEYKDKVCCVIGARGELLRKNRPLVAALVRSVTEAVEYTTTHVDESAKIFFKYTTGITLEDLKSLYDTLNLHHHPTGADLRDEIAFYAEDFRGIGVLKSSTDPQKYADHVYENVLGAQAHKH